MSVAEGDLGAVVVSGLAGGGGAAAERTTVTRFTAAGVPDPTFSGDGKLAVNLIDGYEDAVAVVVQDDGAIVAGGEVSGRLSLIRLTPTGTFDTTFSGDGKVVTNLPGGYEWISSLALQGDGKIVASGRISLSGGRALVARYTTAGVLDTTFSGDGFAPTNFTPAFDIAHDIAVDPDRDLVSVGSTNDDASLFVQRHLGA